LRIFQPQYIDCVILCGGNVKLKHRNIEKLQCMINIERRPFLSYILDQVSAFSFSKAILAVDKNFYEVQKYCGDSYAFVDLKYSYETSPLGTIGAAKRAVLDHGKNSEILIIKGNIYTQFDIFDMRNFYSYFDFRESLCSLSYENTSGVYLINREELFSYPDVCSFKDLNIKNNYELKHKKNKIIDISNISDLRNIRIFFNDIWGDDWSDYNSSLEEETGDCVCCVHSSRISIGKSKYHGWKMKCLLNDKIVNRRSTCEFFTFPKGMREPPFSGRGGKGNTSSYIEWLLYSGKWNFDEDVEKAQYYHDKHGSKTINTPMDKYIKYSIGWLKIHKNVKEIITPDGKIKLRLNNGN